MTRLIQYDVWGNEETGYDINAAYYADSLDHDVNLADDQAILDYLIEIKFLTADVTLDDIEIDGEPEFTVYFTERKTGYPLGEFRNS